MNPTSLCYPGIDALIVASARKFAHEIDSVLGLNGIDYEDHVQLLVLFGLSQARHYRAGDASLSTFLTAGMIRKKIDILRSYSAAARRPYHPMYRCYGDVTDEKTRPRDAEAGLTEQSYVAEQAGIPMILSLLTKEEQTFALALLRCSVEEAGRSVGWKRGTTFRRLAAIRRKLEPVWSDYKNSGKNRRRRLARK